MCVQKGRSVEVCVCVSVRQSASLHDKKVVPILRILGTDATYYLLLLLSFGFFFSFRSETYGSGATQ